MTNAAFKKLQAEWDKHLENDGFQDLESASRDGPLSNRGKIHAKYDDGGPALVERLEHGAEYVRWCQQVLLAMPRGGDGHRRYRVWKLHTEGDSLKMIADKLGLNFHVVRAIVMQVEEKHRCRETRQVTRAERRRAAARRMVRKIPTETLVQLVAAMAMATRRSSPSRSAA